MHKKIIAIILSLMITSALFAREPSEKTITIGTDILPLIGGLPFGFVGLLHNDGKNEINFGSFYFNDDDENISAIGLFPSYSFYPRGKGKGIFFEGGGVISLSMVKIQKTIKPNKIIRISLLSQYRRKFAITGI